MLIAQNDVVEHRHGLHQHEVLMHHADAQLYRLTGGVDTDFLPLQKNLPLESLADVLHPQQLTQMRSLPVLSK